MSDCSNTPNPIKSALVFGSFLPQTIARLFSKGVYPLKVQSAQLGEVYVYLRNKDNHIIGTKVRPDGLDDAEPVKPLAECTEDEREQIKELGFKE